MEILKFNRELYSKVALLKAAYNFTDSAYVHLDADKDYYYVTLESKSNEDVEKQNFVNEMLTQSIRHEVYRQTKNIRELLLARALATSIVSKKIDDVSALSDDDNFDENDILKDWFSEDD